MQTRIRRTCCLGAAWLAVAVGAAASSQVGVASDRDAARPQQPRLDVGYLPTPHDVVERLLQLGEVTEKDVVYDLGCGDGRIVVAAARRFGCRAVGVDLDPERIREALALAREHKVEKLVTIRQQDLFQVDLTEASVVTLFLLPNLNVKLIPQLEKMRPGARVLTHEFDIDGIEPEKSVTFVSKEDGNEHLLYLYRLPMRKAKK